MDKTGSNTQEALTGDATDVGFPDEERSTDVEALPDSVGMKARVVGPHSAQGAALKTLLKLPTGYAELSAPELRSVWRWLPVPSLEEGIVSALGEWRGSGALRHWSAFRRFFARASAGLILWKLDEHLDAFGGRTYAAGDRDLRAEATREVELFTRIELGVHEESGGVLWRGKPLRCLFKAEDARALEGSGAPPSPAEMLIQVHPLLLGTVRGPGVDARAPA